MKKYFPIDLSTKSIECILSRRSKFLDEISSENFNKFQNKVIKAIIQISNNDNIIRSIIWDISNDISKILYIYDKIYKINLSGYIPIYDQRTNPLFELIFTNKEPNYHIIKDIFNKKKYDQFSFYNFIKNKLKILYNTDKKTITFMHNDLLNNYIGFNSINSLNLDLHKLNSFKYISVINSNYTNIIEHLTEEIEIYIKELVGIENNNFLKKIINYCLKNNFLNLINFQNYIQSNKSILKYQLFLSGSPKYWGRILSYNYILENKKTYRFSHSLDRVFFDDNLFKFSEYLFCDTYFFPSKKASYDAGKLLNEKNNFYINKNINFKSFKNNIYQNQYIENKKGGNLDKNILYISSTYLSEKNLSYSNDRVDMIKYFEYQEWLLNNVSKLGYKITFKQHPKSYTSITNKNFKLFNKNNIKGLSNKDLNNYSVCIFDYAGSLLFDTMARNIGIVFIDFKIRNWNNHIKDIFKQRCITLEVSKNSKNCYRIDEQSLYNSIEQSKNIKIENTNYFKSYLND